MRRPTRLLLQHLEARDVPASPNLLVTFDTDELLPSVGEFTPTGTLLRSAANPPAPGTDSNGPHDVDVTADGEWVVFNGHFHTSLNVYNPATGSWRQGTFPGWSSVGNDSFGGLTTAGNYVYVPDMFTYNGGEPKGIVRFDLDDLSAERFATGTEYTDLNIGLDGLLYALHGDYGPIDVFYPQSMTLLRTVQPAAGNTFRGVTADADGNLFVVDWNEDVWKLGPTGQVLSSIDLTYLGVYDTHDIDISNDGQYLVVGERFGNVVQLRSNFTGATRFLAGESRGAHATFLEPPPDIALDPVALMPTGGSTAVGESGTTDAYDVVLRRPPSAAVTVTVEPGAGLQASPATLTFTPANWSTPQRVTVAAEDNDVVDGPRTVPIVHTVASADPAFAGLNLEPLDVSITDDDQGGIAISPLEELTLVEGGSGDAYQVVLRSQPLEAVTVTLAAIGELTLSAPTLTFTPADWNVPQTVTVTSDDDAEVEGTETGSISHAVASLDPLYDGLSLPTLTVRVEDDDAGVLVAGSPAVSEAGTTATYTLRLSTAPTGVVTITLDAGSQLQANPGVVTFTPADWDSPRTVTVTAVDDLVAQGDRLAAIGHTVASADLRYDGLVVPPVSVSIADDDVAGFLMTPATGLFVRERGTTVTFTIRPTSIPLHPVTISLLSSDPSEGTVSSASVTFLPGDGLAERTFTITPMDDPEADGDVPFLIVLGDAVSDDPTYDGLAVADLAVTNFDDERLIAPGFPLLLTEEDGDLLRLRFKGLGTGVATLDNPDGDGRASFESIRLTDTTGKSRLTLTVKKRPGGDGRTTLVRFDAGSLASLTAPTTDLVGDGVFLAGDVRSIKLGDLQNGTDLSIANTAKTRIRLGNVGDGSDIFASGPVAALKAASFGDGRLEAPAIGKLNVRSDFAGAVTLLGGGVSVGDPLLGSAVIAGTVEGAVFDVRGSVGSFRSGRFLDSRLYVGFTPGTATDPFSSGTFLPTGTLGSFKVTESFAGSHVAAASIGPVSLRSVDPGNDGTDFGVWASLALTRLSVKDSDYLHVPGQPPPAELVDFIIRVG